MARVTCLAGGVGAARFLLGLREIIPEESITVVVNTGDDEEFHGLRVCPDLDIICYTLSGLVDRSKGWGIAHDTFGSLRLLETYGNPVWFRIGDGDFATHIYRTQLLNQGRTLTEVTRRIAACLGLRCKVLPMSNSQVRTRVRTSRGWLSFQEYFVKEGCRPEIIKISFDGIDKAQPTPQVQRAIEGSDGIIICPSNPIVSIGPTLSLGGLRASIGARRASVVAISPIVAGKTLKGPADRMMRSLGYGSSAYSIAVLYKDIAGTLIVDSLDSRLKRRIEALGMRCLVTNTVMSDENASAQLAEVALSSLGLGA